jgi:hypothetical protein
VPPEWLLWLLPVPLATLAAIAWVCWANRSRGPQDTAVSVREHERFRAALGSVVPPQPRPAVPRTVRRTGGAGAAADRAAADRAAADHAAPSDPAR